MSDYVEAMRPFRRTACALFFAAAPTVATQDVAVRGEIVHTQSGAPLRDAVVVVRDGKIAAVGPADEVEIPDGMRLLAAAVVTPGLIDSHSVVGLAGHLNYAHDQDQLEPSSPIQPELRATDAYNPREPLIEYVRSFGVTTLHTGHAPAAVVSGQTMIVKTRGETVDEASVVPFAMVAAALGDAVVREDDVPGTRAKAVALLRQELLDARAYVARRASGTEGEEGEDEGEGEKGAGEALDLRLEALAAVLRRDVPLLVTAHRAHDILTALRIAEEFELDLVLDGAAEILDVAEPVRAAGVPVILHPTMQRATRERESLSFETAAKLDEAGIPFALQGGYESYVPKTRVVLFEAAMAAAYGLPYERALGSITLDAARLLGVDARVGSLEVGKDGDLALYDGDPFEYTSHCVGVVIEGVVVSEEVR